MKEMQMNVRRNLGIAMLAAVLVSPGWAQTTQPDAPATTQSAMERVLPELRFDNADFNDVMDFLRDLTGMNIVVVRDGGIPADYPRLTVRLRDVTLEQFFTFLQRAYAITADEIDGPRGAVYVVKVPMNEDASFSINATPQKANVEQVYRLSDIVHSLAAGKKGDDAEKQAMNDTLSLLQAALALTPGTPTIKVHEPTQTLIFTGSADQRKILESALQSLQPSEDQKMLQAATQQDVQMRTLRTLRQENDALRKALMDLRVEIPQQPATQPQKD
jgi:hypothetical protein